MWETFQLVYVDLISRNGYLRTSTDFHFSYRHSRQQLPRFLFLFLGNRLQRVPFSCCFVGDLVKNEVIEGCLSSSYLGRGGNGDLSRSVSKFSSSHVTLVSRYNGLPISAVGSTSFDSSWQVESSEGNGESMGCAVTFQQLGASFGPFNLKSKVQPQRA